MKNIHNINKTLQAFRDKLKTGQKNLIEQQGFAAQAQILAKGYHNPDTVIQDAMEYLGLTEREAIYYFNMFRTLPEIETITQPFFDQYGIGQDGYNREGYEPE